MRTVVPSGLKAFKPSFGLGLLDRPERERLSGFKARIFLIREIQPTGAERSQVRLVFSKIEPVEGARVLFARHLDGDQVLISESVDLQNFCRDPDHFLTVFRASVTAWCIAAWSLVT